MFNVCDNCGTYHADKVIDPTGHYAICQDCGHKHRFALQPLMIICGPSGAGKTTVCNRLIGRFQDAVILDGDILWGVDNFFNTWLRMAKNIGQSGRPVVGYDLTFTVPKSASVLWALGDDATRAAVHAAHHSAVAQTLAFVEDKVVRTRVGHAGCRQVRTRGMIAAAFDHWDSRAGDPNLHTHVVIANRAQGSLYKWAAKLVRTASLSFSRTL